jgi:hypothetical protein
MLGMVVTSSAHAQDTNGSDVPLIPQEYGCYAEVSSCIAAREDLAAWANGVIADNPDATIDGGISVTDPSVVPTLIGQACAQTGTSYCFTDTSLNDAQIVYSGLRNLTDTTPTSTPDDIYNIDTTSTSENKCFTGIDQEAVYDACRADLANSDRAIQDATCYLDQNNSTNERMTVCFDYDQSLVMGEGTCYANEDVCQARMIHFLPDHRQNTFRANNELCVERQIQGDCIRGQPGPAGGCSEYEQITRYCMNNDGIAGMSEEEIEDAINQEEQEQALAEYQAYIDAQDARVEADSQALRDSDSLVICSAWDCGWNELIDMVNRVIRFLITISGVLVVIVMMYAGWTLVTSRGSVNKKVAAQSMLTKSIAGFVLVLTAWLIVDVIASALLDDDLESDPIVDILGDSGSSN